MENLINPIYYTNYDNAVYIDNIQYYQNEIFKYMSTYYNTYNYRYLVSNYGRIYDLDKRSIAHQYLIKDYWIFKLNGYYYSVHRLVMMTFCPIEHPELFEVNHYRAVYPVYNHVSNLYWCTHKENMEHAAKFGLMAKGQELPITIATEEQIHIMCKGLENSLTYKQIYESLGDCNLTYTQVHGILSSIVTKKAWTYISKYYDIWSKNRSLKAITEDQIHTICRYLENNCSYDEIYEALGIEDKKEQNRFGIIIYNIVMEGQYKYISSQYNITGLPKKQKPNLFTEEELHYICKKYSEGLTATEILKSMGIITSELNDRDKRRYMTCMSKIKQKRNFTKISNQYF